jgi:hydrogenase maturation protease
MSSLALVGVGNEWRSDDALGILVARELKRRFSGSVRVIEVANEGTSLIEAMDGVEGVILVDALSSSDPPGTVLRFDLSHSGVPATVSTPVGHAFALTGAVELARRLHRLPPVVLLYGIVGKCFDLGTGLSDCVVKSIPELMQRIEEDLQAARAA